MSVQSLPAIVLLSVYNGPAIDSIEIVGRVQRHNSKINYLKINGVKI